MSLSHRRRSGQSDTSYTCRRSPMATNGDLVSDSYAIPKSVGHHARIEQEIGDGANARNPWIVQTRAEADDGGRSCVAIFCCGSVLMNVGVPSTLRRRSSCCSWRATANRRLLVVNTYTARRLDHAGVQAEAYRFCSRRGARAAADGRKHRPTAGDDCAAPDRRGRNSDGVQPRARQVMSRCRAFQNIGVVARTRRSMQRPLSSAADVADRPWFRTAMTDHGLSVGRFETGIRHRFGDRGVARPMTPTQVGCRFRSLNLNWLGESTR